MLFAFGSNGNGQLGIGNTIDQDNPQRCIIHHDENQHPGNLAKITAGGNHTLVLFDSGRLFSAGSNDKGQAGPKARFPSSSNSVVPHTVFTEVIVPSLSQKVKLCSATWEASIIVTLENEVYTFGSGPNGELGTRIEQTRQPQRLLDFPPRGTSVIDLASGVRHTVAVLSNGDVYGWGTSRKGQLGPVYDNIIWAPQKVLGLNFLAKQATCGREFTYVVGDPSEPESAILGSDRWNIVSHADMAHSSLSAERKMSGSSWSSLIVLDTSGMAFSWGRNDRGQLSPKGLPPLEQIAVGSEHTVALTKAGEVLAWGWGEHGNCGPNTGEFGDVRDGWEEIVFKPPTGAGKVLGLGAGCATSFLWTDYMECVKMSREIFDNNS